ncbi:extracellular solute-binding protein [Brachybacterium phenoliresistens]|uniref:extracellular solute-binding protein n=1 Tax=Brachybacterium phenoliresistens TaxID=396014 RepID=UPI0031DC50C0
MISRRHVLSSLPLAAAGAAGLSACGSGSSGGTGGDGSRPLTWMSVLHTPTTPQAGGPVEKGLQESTGQSFELQWVPAASWEEKINAVLASGDIADITTNISWNTSSVRQALSSGMFWEVEDLLADYPNLAAINPTTLDAGRIDGVLYGVPMVKEVARYGVLVRQDWLDRLGLEVPHTIEELEAVAKAFAEGDPTGTGAKVTGFIDRQESFGVAFRTLAGYFGAGDRFQLDEASGQLIPAAISEPWKQAMEWYRGVYEAGGVNQEFITTQKQNQQQAIAQDKGGIVVTGLFEAKNYVSLAESISPDTEVRWTLINDITYADVPRRIVSDTNGGMGGLFSFSTQTLPEEADVRGALALMDALHEEPNFQLMTNGVEGTHFAFDDEGALEIIDQALWEQQVQPYNGSRPSYLVELYKSTNDYVNLAHEMMAENEEFVVTNPAQQLTSATFDRSWSTIEQALSDSYSTFIMGQTTMADYEATIETLRGQGLDDVIAEYTEAYEAVQG